MPRLFLEIDDQSYQVTVEPGFPRDGVLRYVRLDKQDADDEVIYHVTVFRGTKETGPFAQCDCPDFTFRKRFEKDPNTDDGRCKHGQALADVGLISLPPVVVKALPVEVEEAIPF